MRLLEIQQDGTLSLTENLHEDHSIPAHAILSHTWQAGEVTFDEFKNGTGNHKAGYKKIHFSAQQALRDGLRYVWVDTCCINKADAVELQHAINSMFRWYRDAARCYVFLSDVPEPGQESVTATGTPAWEQAFRRSRWFTRGWTLQELLAPCAVSFFSREWQHLGERHELKHRISEMTSIPVSALGGAPLDNFGVDERLSWSNRRQTTHKEDRAYSLLGMFNVFMPLIYGEGEENAFRRLRKGIDEVSQDNSRDLFRAASGISGACTPTATHKACYTLPFPKNRYFVGRRDELETLSQKLLIGRDCDRMSIVGLGGTGKTQLALQFAYMVKETMSAVSVFWLPALSMESFEQACAGIVAALHIGQAGASEDDAKVLVREHLSSDYAGRWLLVLDNADDYDLLFGSEQRSGILDYLPESDKGMTLFTTRVQEVAVSLSRGDVLELGPMSRADATAFLERSLVKKSLAQDSETTGQLLGELACLPLAIAQAAAYLNMNKISVAKYMQLLRSTEQNVVGVMSREFRDHTRYTGSANAVATTWMVSFSQVQARDVVAADLLAFMSCIEWKAIPRSLLPSVQPEERMEEALGTLCGYSFLTRRETGKREGREEAKAEEEWYDMHRLVHLATRIWTNKYGVAAEVTEKAVRHTANVFPSDDYANRAVWRAYLPHVLRLLESKLDSDTEGYSELCLLMGRCLQVDGRIREAVKWLEGCCCLMGRLDEEDLNRLASQHELARAYEADGQVKRAVELLKHVVAVREKVLVEEHPDRLASQHELARAYRSDGQVNKAVELLEHVVAVRRKVLAEEHPARLTSQQWLAITYQADGQVKRAVELMEHVVAVREKVLAEEHPDRLESQHVLAMAYQADGQVKQAVTLMEHVVAVREKMLAEDHPSRLASQHVLAMAYRADGQVKQAVTLMEHVVAVQEKVLAEDHPSRLASQHVLAVAYEADGQVKQAVTLMEHVVAVQEKVLAEDHPSRLASQHVLAVAYEADGQVKQAVTLMEHVVAVQEKVLAEDHPNRLASQHGLARAYQADGQVKQAVTLLKYVVTVKARVLREDHPSRLVSVQVLQGMYVQLAADTRLEK